MPSARSSEMRPGPVIISAAPTGAIDVAGSVGWSAVVPPYRATSTAVALVDTELRGAMIESEAEIHRDFETVIGFAEELTVRYAEGISSVDGDAVTLDVDTWFTGGDAAQVVAISVAY